MISKKEKKQKPVALNYNSVFHYFPAPLQSQTSVVT